MQSQYHMNCLQIQLMMTVFLSLYSNAVVLRFYSMVNNATIHFGECILLNTFQLLVNMTTDAGVNIVFLPTYSPMKKKKINLGYEIFSQAEFNHGLLERSF
eukprot:TRINITY_DN4562_c0_g1_i1.p1 TRINITY_DN4562_c0_g1~~TRINITY_DN4562_c0_g1_i1.p1  ORF type:complete len:101 (-),score=2.67 TRINITY_DN4562_c0_g1_i1:118-420(-)